MGWRRWASLGLGPLVAVVAAGAGLWAASCSVVGVVGQEAAGVGGALTTATVVGAGGAGGVNGTGGAPAAVTKVDLVLGIDNARSMGDKQSVLSLTIDDLLDGLTNPPCFDTNGQTTGVQPATGLDPCPVGTARRFTPVTDLHLGVVTASLGGHGGDACPDSDTTACAAGAVNASQDDHGHLITRVAPCGTTTLSTYEGGGFLAWDPRSSDSPPGTTDLGVLGTDLQGLAGGAGDLGCFFASQLESWYRFLVDPDPYGSVMVVNGSATQFSIDAVLLGQRQDFLRPDSLVAILMVSDSDDCSVMDSGLGYYTTQIQDPTNPSQPFHMPRARAECATNPDDPCCRSCVQDQTGCATDSTCTTSPVLDEEEDDWHLRCWDQKRRFGMDLLYDTNRYVLGLTQPTVPNRSGEMVDNPLFSTTDPAAVPRSPSLVILGGIVGVPWQDVAVDPTDLGSGFKTAGELAAVDGGVSTWDVILGTPSSGKAPLDPHMVESTQARSGVDPATGTALAPPTAPAGADPVSGHEFTEDPPTELQYACTFALPAPLDCTNASLPSCDCTDPANDKPLCAADPSTGQRTLQVQGRAYPALRQLAVLHDMGTQGVVASVCPAQQTDASRADYAYRPAVQAFVDRIGVTIGGQ